MDESARARLLSAIAAGVQLGAVACAKQAPVAALAADASVAALDASSLDAGDAGAIADASDASTDASAAASLAAAALPGLLRDNAICGVAIPGGVRPGPGARADRNICGAAVQPNATPQPAPEGDVAIGQVTSGIPSAARVVAALRGHFRNCYRQALTMDPAQSGKVVITATLAPDGEVNAANVTANSGLSPPAVACLKRALRNAQFYPPGGAEPSVVVPLTFSLAKK